ncbi:MAG: SPASM domain-containing protein, partial [Deltaproteobacteria bacterium]|nr:SPASM domain-containing protein [Deltaproteobacteria bacterium]
VAVLTNGSALQGDTAKHLAQGASWVRISIDAADRNTFAKSRNVKVEEFDKVMKNIDDFAGMKNDDCELGINLIVTELNFHRVYDFIGLMKSKGANHVKVCGCVVSTDGHENNVYHASYFDQVMSQINRAEDDLSCESFHVINKFHNLKDKFDKRYSWCPFINFLNVIAADLCVYTCQDKAYTKTGFLGLIREQSLRELWQSDEYKERLHGVNPSIICDHHCVQHEKNLALLDYLTTDTRHLEFV